MKKYRRRSGTLVAAVQLDLDTDGFTFRQWGALQTCKRGDWIVSSQGGTHTVDQEVFARTYRRVSLGVYEKITPVWAVRAEQDGAIRTREGVTHYKAGHWIVYNDPDGDDGYAMGPETFESLYEPADDPES